MARHGRGAVTTCERRQTPRYLEVATLGRVLVTQRRAGSGVARACPSAPRHLAARRRGVCNVSWRERPGMTRLDTGAPTP